MTIGERIREIRQLRGMTQKELGNAVGLNATRIGHYEMDFRKPKKETLKAIANALHVGISVFEDIEIETLCDVKAILFQLDAKIGITFHGEKDINGKYIEGTVTLSFDNPQIAIFLKEWADIWTELSDFDIASENYEKHLQENVSNMVLSEKIRKYRKICNLTQKELGMLCGFPEKSADSRIREFESGKTHPKQDILQKIADALNVSILDLLDIKLNRPADLLEILFILEKQYGFTLKVMKENMNKDKISKHMINQQNS